MFKRKRDPISARSRELNSKIQRLEAEIRTLSAKTAQSRAHPRVRSTALPHGSIVRSPPSAATKDPIFEPVEVSATAPEFDTNGKHYNELGVRKYDLVGALKRLKSHFRGPPASNPKLVSYLAAGSIKGLRPLRYEKRVARNRFIFLSIFFLFILWVILAVIFNAR